MFTQSQLTEARNALHTLLLGKRPQSIMYDGRRVEFTESTKDDLVKYIQRIESFLGESGSRSGPARGSF